MAAGGRTGGLTGARSTAGARCSAFRSSRSASSSRRSASASAASRNASLWQPSLVTLLPVAGSVTLSAGRWLRIITNNSNNSSDNIMTFRYHADFLIIFDELLFVVVVVGGSG
jgi:hypothetical protein